MVVSKGLRRGNHVWTCGGFLCLWKRVWCTVRMFMFFTGFIEVTVL